MVIKIRYGYLTLALVFIICIIASVLTFKTLTSNVDVSSVQKDSVCVPIIVYHEVKLKLSNNYVIAPYEFESDLKYLAANHYSTVTMNQLVDYVYYGKSLPENPIVLSFDDGYLDNYKYVYPLLKEYNMKIVLSLIAKNTDDFTRIPDDNLEYSHVTWDQLNEMLASGLVEVQNHTYNLHSNKSGRVGCMQMSGESDSHYEQVLSEDLMKCQEEIKQMTGATPNTFTYPYGTISRNAAPILKKLGFKATLSCNYGVNLIKKDPDSLYDLKRICRMHGKPLSKALKDGMDTLRFLKDK